MKLLSVLLFLIVAVSILLVSILINPDQIQNQYFWITVGWLIVLSALNWIASTSIFIGASQSNANSRTYGILPPLNILVFIYSLFSGILLLSTWYVNDFGILPNWHLILQIILFAIVSTLSVLMFIAAKAAKVDDVKVALNKEDLIKVLQSIRSLKDLNEEKKELIEELIEIVRYSIPHLSKLNSKDNYNQLSSLYRNMNIDNYVNIKTSDIEKSIYLAKNC
tara:strand:+ start:2452 stop:3117 length:666 start_codon:yes stop_codon:yes gene_type:complete